MSAFGNAAQDYIEKRIDINEHCIVHPAATFFMTAEGESLIEAGIHHGALLVIDRSLPAKTRGYCGRHHWGVNSVLNAFIYGPHLVLKPLMQALQR
uniref:Peptidase S24/S26A/S26B/S26C domain-containing protein n=1 Tax=Yersinia enterocolitica W22703 TaxID=913028 RepID=F4MX10_YEREN|nr:hypothetical protein YEW_JP41080 [Yersinia enterocolitica W22703]